MFSDTARAIAANPSSRSSSRLVVPLTFPCSLGRIGKSLQDSGNKPDSYLVQLGIIWTGHCLANSEGPLAANSATINSIMQKADLPL